MNIYEKLQTMRCELQKTQIKKTGKNKFAGYEYFELGDFLPVINELMMKYRLTTNISFGVDMAILTLIDIDKPEDTTCFTSPMSSAELKSCHAVQNLGAVQTYLRRYLYMNCFEIVEADPLESSVGNGDSTSKKVLTEAQIKRAYAIANGAGVTNEQVKQWIMTKYKKTSLSDLTKKEYDELVTSLEAKKAG